MEEYRYGNPASSQVLVQLVDEHDLEGMENEVRRIREETEDFALVALKAEDWNRDLSPWEAPAVFGKENFGGGAEKTLAEVLSLCSAPEKTYFLGGYSLAGFFALWAAYQTDKFSGIAAASPSVWFPDFADYVQAQKIKCPRVYLSLGDKEEKARNPIMATVGENIRSIHAHLVSQGIDTTLEWNKGNHFRDADLRTGRAFSWLLGKKNS